MKPLRVLLLLVVSTVGLAPDLPCPETPIARVIFALGAISLCWVPASEPEQTLAATAGAVWLLTYFPIGGFSYFSANSPRERPIFLALVIVFGALLLDRTRLARIRLASVVVAAAIATSFRLGPAFGDTVPLSYDPPAMIQVAIVALPAGISRWMPRYWQQRWNGALLLWLEPIGITILGWTVVLPFWRDPYLARTWLFEILVPEVLTPCLAVAFPMGLAVLLSQRKTHRGAHCPHCRGNEEVVEEGQSQTLQTPLENSRSENCLP